MDQDFRVFEIFEAFSVSKLITIYEYVELEIYPEILKSIDPQYKFQFPSASTAQNSVDTFLNKICNDFCRETMLESLKVLKRVICRVLTANTSDNIMIADYFGLESFWSKEFEDKAEKVCDAFPKDFKFSHAISLENLMEKKVKVMA